MGKNLIENRALNKFEMYKILEDTKSEGILSTTLQKILSCPRTKFLRDLQKYIDTNSLDKERLDKSFVVFDKNYDIKKVENLDKMSDVISKLSEFEFRYSEIRLENNSLILDSFLPIPALFGGRTEQTKQNTLKLQEFISKNPDKKNKIESHILNVVLLKTKIKVSFLDSSNEETVFSNVGDKQNFLEIVVVDSMVNRNLVFEKLYKPRNNTYINKPSYEEKYLRPDILVYSRFEDEFYYYTQQGFKQVSDTLELFKFLTTVSDTVFAKYQTQKEYNYLNKLYQQRKINLEKYSRKDKRSGLIA